MKKLSCRIWKRHAVQWVLYCYDRSFHQAGFIEALSLILRSDSNSRTARIAAALQLKNCLTSKNTKLAHEYRQRWLSLSSPLRDTVKVNILSTLNSDSTCLGSTVAQCVAYVAAAEIPANQWTDLITTLCTTINSSAMDTIGFICQEIV